MDGSVVPSGAVRASKREVRDGTGGPESGGSTRTRSGQPEVQKVSPKVQ